VKKIAGEYPRRVRVVFRQFPLRSIHAQAQKAAEASLCAFDQGRFWEMHDALFGEIKKLGTEDLTARARRLNLDMEAFNQCLESSKYAATVQQDLEDGMAVGVSGTPAVFINGRPLKGSPPYKAIKKMIEEELKRTGSRLPS
jgi:protein-disulfide isomerase